MDHLPWNVQHCTVTTCIQIYSPASDETSVQQTEIVVAVLLTRVTGERVNIGDERISQNIMELCG